MKMTVGPYHNSPYDASGMPLATTYVDYDNLEDVAKATVKDKPVEHPTSLLDIDYQPKQLTKKETGMDPRYITKKGFNSALADEENVPYSGAETADFDDPEEKRKLAVKDAFSRDIGVMKLPETEKPEVVKEVAQEVRNDEMAKEEDPAKDVDTDFINLLDDRVDEVESQIDDSEKEES